MENISEKEKYSLAAVKPADAKDLFHLIEKNRDYFKSWLPNLPKNLKEEERFLIDLNKDKTKHGFVILNSDGFIIGLLTSRYVSSDAVAIGYMLDPTNQGKGIATKAVKTFVNFLFKNCKISKIELRTNIANTRSISLAERCGFKKELILKKSQLLNGKFVDQVLYSIKKKNLI